MQTKKSRKNSMEAGTGEDEESLHSQPSMGEEETSQGEEEAVPAAEKPAPQQKKSLRLLVSKSQSGGSVSSQTLESIVMASKEDVQSDLEKIHENWVKRLVG
jgi:outer membrane translocation and assembly module TamA